MKSGCALSILALDVPRAFAPLLQPARYKGAYGGRGGAKSHFFAEQLILRCIQKRTRWVCIREVQNTIKESVHQLLVDKIAKLGVEHLFDVRRDEIRGPHGSLITFRGMQSFNADNIKSLEDYDGAWIEEAQTLSERSLRLLRPTIRREGSEIWASWNPRHDTDAVDVFLRQKPPEGAIVVSVGWQDNPWFPEVLRVEKDHDYATDADMAEHVWGGGYEIVSEAYYYARWIAQAEKEGRVGFFPWRRGLPVHTSWDIGVDDYTAVWFWQEDGRNARVIDYYETQNDGAEQIVNAALPEFDPDLRRAARTMLDIGRDDPWVYGNHYLPHDVRVREWGAGARSRVESLMELGLRNIVKGAQLGPEERVNASRRLLPLVQFHQTERVAVGIRRLRRYARKLNEQMNVYTGPLKDGNDHGADAFGEYAVNCPLTVIPEIPKPKPWVLQTGVRIGPPGPEKKRRRL
jgi:phage terminase large subunit